MGFILKVSKNKSLRDKFSKNLIKKYVYVIQFIGNQSKYQIKKIWNYFKKALAIFKSLSSSISIEYGNFTSKNFILPSNIFLAFFMNDIFAQ